MSVTGADWGDRLRFHYRLATAQGEILETSFDAEPLEITLGAGEIAPQLERWLVGLVPGDHRTFVLTAAEAFGPCDPARVHRLDASVFPPELQPTAGALMEFSMPSGTLLGTVVEVDEHGARVDFNHPLCGCGVVFEVEVLAVTPRGADPRAAPR